MSDVVRDPLYRRHRSPAEVIAHAVWVYFRFPLRLRMVEDTLATRGIIVTHQTIRNWADKFGQHFAGEIKRRPAGWAINDISTNAWWPSMAISSGSGAPSVIFRGIGTPETEGH